MKFRALHRSTTTTLTLVLGASTAVFMSFASSFLAPALATAPADTSFPDTQGYWGQPFIQALAERDIVTGYLDSTYRPEQPVARDEFAAILRKAFSQSSERQISSGSVYTDVPDGYWASPAIQEAYEMGFMKGYPGGEFRPNQPVTKVEVLVSLAENLDLPAPSAEAMFPETTNTQAAVAVPATTPQQPTRRQRAKRQFMFPMAMTSLMQPFMTTPARAANSSTVPYTTPTTPTQSAASPTIPQEPVSFVVTDYYDDATQIPQYAVDDVARTTTARIVVNHPNPRLLNPNQPATRGEVAALIHQVLVHQGRVNSLPTDEPATTYIVGR